MKSNFDINIMNYISHMNLYKHKSYYFRYFLIYGFYMVFFNIYIYIYTCNIYEFLNNFSYKMGKSICKKI